MDVNKKIEWAIKIIIVLTFFVPFIVGSQNFIFPFIVPKILMFRSLALIMLGLYAMLLVSNWHEYRPRWSMISLMISLWLASLALSTFLGVDWYHSFWDRHERMLGTFTLIHFVVYYFVLTTVVREQREWQWLGRIFAVCASVVMGLGIAQKINPMFLLNNGSERVSATLGNSIYLGGYGLFLFFLSLLLFFWEDKKWARVAAGFGAILGFVGVIISGTRGSFLGLLSGFAVLFAVYTITLEKEHKKAKRWLIVLGCAVILTGVVLFIFRQRPVVANIPTVGKLLNTSFTHGTATTRLMAWGIAVEGWQERPILGWGPNNYIYVFNKYYRPQFLEQGWGETWFDNAHNIIVNTLATQGVLGVTIYLGLFATAAGSLLRAYRAGRADKHLLAIVAGFLGAHLIQNVFVFENPTSYLYFMFWLAMCNSLLIRASKQTVSTKETESKSKSGASSKNKLVIASVVSAGLVFILIFSMNVNPARANMAMLLTLRKLYRGQDPISQYQKASTIWSPHIDDIRNDFARSATGVAPEYARQGRAEEGKAMLLLSYAELDKNIKLHPLDLRIYLQQAQTAQLAFELFQNRDLMEKAEARLESALSLSPKRQQLHYMLASARFFLRDIDGAVAILKESIDYDPVISEGWWRLALIYEQAGKSEQAKSVVREARKIGVVFGSEGQNIVNRILP